MRFMPKILSSQANAATPLCPRCWRANPAEVEFCAGCGMNLRPSLARRKTLQSVLRKVLGFLDLDPTEIIMNSGLYYTVCTAQHGQITGWVGPARTNTVDAEQDVAEHVKVWPGHRVVITEQ